MIRSPIVTVFGGTGFLGHAVVQALAAKGYRILVPTRDIEKANDLKLMGAVGQIVPVETALQSDAAIAALLEKADIVVNLIGILFEKGKHTFQAAHVETAARIARLAKAEGVTHFIHVSALGANLKAKARYARTKALGEEAVHAFFPEAVLLRPGVLFGPRDKFLMRFAFWARFLPFLPLIGGGRTRFQPVYAGDVAAAVLAGIEQPAAKGRVFLLGGPKTYRFKELMDLLLARLGKRRLLIPVPWGLAKLKAFVFELLLPEPPLTRDQVELLKTDNVIPPSSPYGGLAALGLKPKDLDAFLQSALESEGP